jgi:hypothetical protein
MSITRLHSVISHCREVPFLNGERVPAEVRSNDGASTTAHRAVRNAGADCDKFCEEN